MSQRDTAVTPLSDEFLRPLVAELTSPDTVAIILAGSYAHGDATPYSDVDIGHLVSNARPGSERRYQYRDGRLISVTSRPLSWYRTAVARPESAIFYVAGLREARILLDEAGIFRAFQHELERFSWESLQGAADAYASEALVHLTETSHKILSALAERNAFALFDASMGLVLALTQTVAAQRGVLVTSSRTYLPQVWESVGLDSAWTRYRRMIVDSDDRLPRDARAMTKGVMTLRLYQETFSILRPVMQPEHRDVVAQTVAIIDAALGQLDVTSTRYAWHH